MGLKLMVEVLHAKIDTKIKTQNFNILFAVLLVLTTAMTNAAGNYRATDTWAEDYARVLLFPLENARCMRGRAGGGWGRLVCV